jgi:tetratricopeptide (TPR) repeat protein
MKIRIEYIVWLLLAAFVVGGCQSVPTTSAILRNNEGNYELAIDLAKQGIQQNPRDAEAYFQLGIAYSNLDSVGLAYNSFTKSVELDASSKRKENAENNIKHNYSKHYNSGQAAFQDKDYEAAALEFGKAAKADPRQSVAYYNLAVAYSRLAESDSSFTGEHSPYHDKAISALEESLEKARPDQAHYIDALGLVGKELAEIGRLDEALARFERLVEDDPSNYAVIENLGYERYKTQDWKGAEKLLEMASRARIKVGAQDPKLYVELGRVCFFQMDTDPNALRRSVEYYERALDLEPDQTQTIMNLILAYMKMEDWSSAINWGEKYVSLEPDKPDGWRMLALSYSKFGDKDKAAHCAEKYAELMAKESQGQQQ